MAVKLNKPGLAQAQELIADRRIVDDAAADWNAHRPSARDEDLFIAEHGWAAYERWHLGVEDALPARTKPHYRIPYGDFRDVHRCAVRAAAGQDGLYGVARFLDNLLETAMRPRPTRS
jgi:hypothetical protein